MLSRKALETFETTELLEIFGSTVSITEAKPKQKLSSKRCYNYFPKSYLQSSNDPIIITLSPKS